VDKLKWLVVQRLFEMMKLGMNGVGVLFFFDSHLVNSLFLLGNKLREKISKALKTQAEAIHCTLNDSNEAARELDPPREPLTWEKVINTITLADFDPLHDTWRDSTCMSQSHKLAFLHYLGTGGDHTTQC
jgi:hypothetical protein